MNRLVEELKRLSGVPGRETPEWLSSAESAVEFLKVSSGFDTLVLFASMNAVLIHAVLAPFENLDPPDQHELSRDFLMLEDSWRITHVSGGGEPDRVYLAPPMSGLGKTLKGGEKLVFRRSFEGRHRSAIEVSQKLVHALDLHFMDERKAYCRLNADGDIEDVIRVVEERHDDGTQDVTLVTVLAKDFAEYMRLAGVGMVIFFDFTRTQRGSFGGWSGVSHFDSRDRDLFYHGGVMGTQGSYVNGRMILRPTVTYDEIVKEHMEERSPTHREYATFKAIDLRTSERIEVSCSPEAVSNYFEQNSSLPLEMSPAFFRAEVLHKYKADPDKYELTDRSIYCRGTWSLKTFDVNEAGQVHMYLRYLRMLPHKEQLYWQSFNEWPKGPISERALTTDFKGEFFRGRDPLNSLKRKIIHLDEVKPSWWHPRGEELRNAVHVPATTSPAEWANEILALDQLLNEGFRLKQLRALARSLGRSPEDDWKVFKLLEECLKASGVEGKTTETAIAALRSVRELRNILKGHAAIEKRRARERKATTNFGSFRAHFENLTADADAAVELIVRTLGPNVGRQLS